MMDLNRGTLARVDRRLMTGLERDETGRMVRVPVTEAKWSTWKRYCDAAGISMSRAIMALIERELVSIFDESAVDCAPVFAERAEEQLAAREAHLAARELAVEATEERLRGWNDRLGLWHGELETLVQRTEVASKLAVRPVDHFEGRPQRTLPRADQVSITSTVTGWPAVSRVVPLPVSRRMDRPQLVQGNARYGRSLEGVAGCEDVAAFARVDEDFREVILGDNLRLPLDPERWFTFGAVGLWLLVVGILALRDRRLPLRSVTWHRDGTVALADRARP
jgi:hypothetical protein